MKQPIVAACDGCGRGYLTLRHEGVRCLAQCGGRVWLLSSPEPDDGGCKSWLGSERRRAAVAGRVPSDAVASQEE